jgi:hypothetical protein
MAKDLGLELAFDLDSAGKGGYDGFLDLACTVGDKLASIHKLKKADKIFFAIYDESDAANVGRGTPTELRVTFASAANGQNGASPLAVTSLTLSTFQSRGSKGSPEYKNAPSWYAQGSRETDAGKPTTFELVNPGHFFITVELDVEFEDKGATARKTFGQDPRMDVDT